MATATRRLAEDRTELTFEGDVLSLNVMMKDASSLYPVDTRSGWLPLVRESYAGAWQRNVDVVLSDVQAYSAVFACETLIASDVSKLRMRLVELDSNGIWVEEYSPAFSPVLRKPNRYQTWPQFVQQWVLSKLIYGNTYVLKERDSRGVVVALYVLDATKVTPLNAVDGAVYYQLGINELAGIQVEVTAAPAREVIHDRMYTMYHPLVGISPIYACGLAATQGLRIQENSALFFGNGSNPGGVLTAPGAISDATAARLKAYWDENYTGANVGKVAVLGDGLKYEAMAITAVDAQLIEQLKWTAETVCSCFHVPAYMVGVGPPPPYANVAPLVQQYYSQCLQSQITNIEYCLDEGLGLGPTFGNRYGTEFDVDDLIWMDATTKTKAAADSIGSGGMSPDEARKRYLGLGPVAGGNTPYLQQQYYSLAALDRRDQAAPPPSSTGTTPSDEPADEAEADDMKDFEALFAAALMTKAVEADLYEA